MRLGSEPAAFDSAGAARWSDGWWAAITLGFAALVYPFVWRGVLGEDDLALMLADVVAGARSGEGLVGWQHYGAWFSAGYYALLYALVPDELLGTTASAISLINWSGFVSAVMLVAALYRTVAVCWGRAAAAATAILFAGSPVYLELATSGHPVLPSLALIFCGSALALAGEGRGARSIGPIGRWVGRPIALVLVALGLAARLDSALLLPFLALASTQEERRDPRRWRAGAVRRAAFLLFALGLGFGWSMRSGTRSQPFIEQIVAFLSEFYRGEQLVKGVVVAALAAGLVSAAGCALLALSYAGEGRALAAAGRHRLVAFLVLLVPTLAAWLPNPTPARHFVLAVLAEAFLLGGAIALRAKGTGRAAAGALAVALANQLAAEVAYPHIASRYAWAYQQLGERRATAAVPLGAFPLNHAANAVTFRLAREEGRWFARRCAGDVLVFGDSLGYLRASLVEQDRGARVRRSTVDGRALIEIETTRCRALFVAKNRAYPADIVPEFLAAAAYRGFRVYFQERTRTRHDQAPIPPKRRLPVPEMDVLLARLARPPSGARVERSPAPLVRVGG